MEKAKKSKTKKLSGTKQILPVPYEQVEAELSDGLFGDDVEQIKDSVMNFWHAIYKKRGYKNFDLEFV